MTGPRRGGRGPSESGGGYGHCRYCGDSCARDVCPSCADLPNVEPYESVPLQAGYEVLGSPSQAVSTPRGRGARRPAPPSDASRSRAQ